MGANLQSFHFDTRLVLEIFDKKKHLNARGLRMNISAPVRSSDPTKVSKNAYSLVDCTRKKNFFGGVRIGCE